MRKRAATGWWYPGGPAGDFISDEDLESEEDRPALAKRRAAACDYDALSEAANVAQQMADATFSYVQPSLTVPME